MHLRDGWWTATTTVVSTARSMSIPGWPVGTNACGVYSAADVNSNTAGDKRRQACAAKALFDTVGLSAWAR
jgi:hypothetical protein